MSDDETRIVPTEEALKRIGRKKYIHTFRNPNASLLIGADWLRDDLVALFEKTQVEESGPGASAMGHTLVVRNHAGFGPLFIEAKPRPVEVESRSVLKRKAAQRGEPLAPGAK